MPIGRFGTSVSALLGTGTVDSVFEDFVIEGESNTALSGSTRAPADAAYAGGTFSRKSFAVVLDFTGDGTNSKIGFAIGGAAPASYTAMTGVNLNSSGEIDFAVRYADGKLRVSVGPDYSVVKRIDLPAIIGGQTAYVGFSGSAGAYVPNSNSQTSAGFRRWNYHSTEALAFTAPATAIVADDQKSAALSAQAVYASDANIAYAWSTTRIPNGAAAPVLADANDPTTSVTFNKAGTYRMRLTATDSDGATTSSTVSIHVDSRASGIRVAPHAQLIPVNSRVLFSGSVFDQFGRALPSQPPLAFSILDGSGAIDPGTGVYHAGAERDHLIVSVLGDGFTGLAGETIVKR